jgi:hypothetical protein
MAKATVEGNGKRSLKPSFNSKLKKFAGAVPGIVGASILEGIGGPKARAGGKVANFAARTGAKIIAERKGAAILAEKAARTGKISKVAARREAEKVAGQKAVRVGGNKALKSVVDKPKAKIITKTGNPKKDTVSTPPKLKPARRSPVTVTRTTPKKSSDVVSSRLKAQRDRIREALTVKVNPARPKITPKRDVNGGANRTDARNDEIVNRYYRIKNRDSGGPETRGGQSPQDSIDKRLAKGAEKEPRSSKLSDKDYEADERVNEALNPKSRLKAKVKPGVPTRTTTFLKSKASPDKIKGAIRNQRKVIEGRKLRTAAGTKSVNAIKAEEVKKSGSWKNGKAK